MRRGMQLVFTTVLVSLVASPLLARTDAPINGVVSVAELQKENKTPDIPEGYQSQFQALVIRQQQAQMRMSELVRQYNEAAAALGKANADGLALQEKMFKEMGVSPKDYHVQLSDTGVLVVVHDPPKDAGKKEEKK